MADSYRVFASYLLFAQVLEDPLGHLYRAGEFGPGGVRRLAWLRVFDGPDVPAESLCAAFDRVRTIGEAVHSTNVANGVACLASDSVPALACDHVASQPLGLVLDRVRSEQFPVPVDNALLILEKISLALSAGLSVEIEGGRVLHGFLHPGLVFVTYDGECVVSGFGFGEELLATVDVPDSAGAIHPYLAPEVLLSRTPSRRGDVYSLGAILFQLLTGSPLPTDPEERVAAIENAHMAYDEEPVPDDIKTLLSRSLAESPQERFSSASDFKKELDRLLYGGAYSPTTFNLALFMDRLFRAEMEEEDRALEEERAIDTAPYLAPEPTLEPEVFEDESDTPFREDRRNLLLGVGAAAIIAVAATLWLTIGRSPSAPPPPPTPTAAELTAQRLAQEEKMRELAQTLVQEMMAEKEAEIRYELTDRQAKIEELQRRLVESEKRAKQGELSNEEKRQREALQRQIAAEEEARNQREAELEAERLRAEDEARQQARARQTATAVADEAADAEAVATSPTIPPAQPTTTVPTPAPPAVPSPVPTTPRTAAPTAVAADSRSSALLEVNSFVEPSEADTLPVAIKVFSADWPVTAQRSRRKGVIIMQATVNADGLVDEVKILRADEEGFGIPEAAIAAARKYRFKPGTKDGVRIRTYATITQAFRFANSR